MTFDPSVPNSWSWETLNDWLRTVDDPALVDRALSAELKRSDGARPMYARRIRARYRRLLSMRDKAALETSLKRAARKRTA